MGSITNASIEQHYFEQFREHFPLPRGEVQYTDKPDVLLHGDKRIGIEIARLFLVDGKDPASEQVQSGRRNQVLDLAQQKYLSGGGRRIELTVAFDGRHPINDSKAIAKSLATLATRIASGPAGEVGRDLFASIPELEFVYHNPREYPDAKWRTAQVYTTPLLAVERLSELVTAKHAKIGDYTPCDALWMLVIVDMADSAQDQDIRWPEATEPVLSQFERIIIYKPQCAEWTEAPIKRDG